MRLQPAMARNAPRTVEIKAIKDAPGARRSVAGGPSFDRALRKAIDSAPKTGRTAADNMPQVVVSPFNPLGLPVSTTLAPTSEEVAANPQRYAGTSFDPARRINGLRLEEPPEQAPPAFTAWTPQMFDEWNRVNYVTVPPPGSRPTRDPNVFFTAGGATWHRQGTVPVHATSADYERWRQATFFG